LDTNDELSHSVWLKSLSVPFLLIFISLIMAFIYFIIYLYSYLPQYFSDLPQLSIEASYWFSVISILTVPLFVTGISLFLLTHMRTKSNVAGVSRLVLLCGAVLLFVSAAINLVITHRMIYSWDWSDEYEFIRDLSFISGFLTQLGLIFCIIATFFLIRSFIRGDLFSINEPRGTTELTSDGTVR